MTVFLKFLIFRFWGLASDWTVCKFFVRFLRGIEGFYRKGFASRWDLRMKGTWISGEIY